MKIFITGGAGFLGTELTQFYLKQNQWNKVIVYSRDEAKHWKLESLINNKRLKCVVGDVCSPLLFNVLSNETPDTVIIAHALKRIDACESNPEEAIRVNVTGVQNIIDCINKLAVKPKRVILISTDKAVNPITTYGTTKLLAEQLILNAGKSSYGFSVARYGNVLSSTGSIIPIIKEKIERNKPLVITNTSATRFIFTVEKAVEFLDFLIEGGVDGLWMPSLSSMKISDLISLYSEKHQLAVIHKPSPFREKIHEVLNNEYESPKQHFHGSAIYYNLYYYDKNTLPINEYSSANHLISKDSLEQILINAKLL